ncbi:MAG TPA: pyridoxal-phosphate dependent enzyme [Gaiellaceae bacterium]|nr:pyridoxal-phosphate dependent enzyme [Gaiellaceae bacterium]
MTPFALRCRVCEEVTAPEPLDACRRCDGPTDVTYDWERVSRLATREAIAGGTASLWRYHPLLPAGARIEHGAGWTPLRRAGRLSDALGIDLRLKLEDRNPTRSYKDRLAAIAVSAALDHGVTTLCCSSTGNLGDAVAAASAAAGLEAVVLAPVGGESAAVAARHPGAHVFAVDGTYDDCRRLELELGSLFPWGFVSGNLHPYASEGAKTISFEIAEQLGWRLPDAVVCPAASGTLVSKLAQGFTELVRAGLAEGALPRHFAAQAEGASPIADAFADDRRISRVEAGTAFASLAVGDPSHGDLAIGAARATGGRIVAVAEAEIRAQTDLLAATCDVVPDASGGAALAALVDAVRRGDIEPGSLVVLVVTGARPEPSKGDESRATTVRPDARDVLEALGLRS